jgi:hypothetical protein
MMVTAMPNAKSNQCLLKSQDKGTDFGEQASPAPLLVWARQTLRPECQDQTVSQIQFSAISTITSSVDSPQTKSNRTHDQKQGTPSANGYHQVLLYLACLSWRTRRRIKDVTGQ